MRQLIPMMALAIAALFMGTSTYAQVSTQQRLSREELAEKQARHIAHELALDDDKAQRYIATYCAYQKEVWALGARTEQYNTDEHTEAEAEQANKARIEQRKKILALREKYYEEYSKYLTQKQIERASELELQTMRRLAAHRRQSLGSQGTHNHRHAKRNR